MSILPSVLQRKVLLRITAEDHATEIFVIDGDFQLVGRGVGELSVSVAPGIYKVKLRAGVQTAEKLVVLTGEKAEQELNLDAFEFSSAVPLERTAKTHEFHIAQAQGLSTEAQFYAGQGSWIYVFARDWTSKERPAEPARFANPAAGLTLWNMEGVRVAYVAEGRVTSEGWDPCVGCNVEVRPGAYLLRLELPAGGGTVERLLFASPLWQTQVFLLQRDYGRGPESREADLSGGSVLLSPGPGFDAANPSHRLTELARLALKSGRHQISGELRKSLEQTLKNPMLGIYGAHLLLLEPKPDYDLVRRLVEVLRAMLGRHPDVEAVALKLPDARPDEYRFESPPMLRRSWTYIVEATSTRPGLVPPESLAGRISTRIWGDGAWLTWATPPANASAVEVAAGEAERPASESVLDEALVTELRHLYDASEAKKLAPPPPRPLPLPVRLSESMPLVLLDVLRWLYDHVWPEVKLHEDDAPKPRLPTLGGKPEPESGAALKVDELLDEETIATLVQTFGIPRATVEKTLHDIERRAGALWGREDG
jgi:hypothetical protein